MFGGVNLLSSSARFAGPRAPGTHGRCGYHAGQQEGNGGGLPSQNCHSSPLLSAIRSQSRAIVEPQWMRDTVMLSSGPQTLPISDVYYI